MIYHPTTLEPTVSFHRLRDDAVWLEALLAIRNVPIGTDTELWNGLALAKSLPALSASPPGAFDPRALAAPLGLTYLARALSDAKGNSSFEKICRLLPKLAGRGGVPVAQNTPRTAERDLVFDLEMAAVFASMGALVESADEPDVAFTYDGSSWDVACKLIYTQKPVSLNDRLEEGVGQILRFPSNYGLVCIGVTNRVDHCSASS